MGFCGARVDFLGGELDEFCTRYDFFCNLATIILGDPIRVHIGGHSLVGLDVLTGVPGKPDGTSSNGEATYLGTDDPVATSALVLDIDDERWSKYDPTSPEDCQNMTRHRPRIVKICPMITRGDSKYDPRIDLGWSKN